ncbi:hypothetical protein GCM10027290_46390 [Micromonospora sonneratiae]|uniref:Transposase family protein n=1 Tax=Micromonospora sonneratiae TaxID=1184706 RepID=A0ABW3YAF5_9ACTN
MATRLLGLDGLAVERVELDAEGCPVVDLFTGDEQARCCPGCGQRAVRVKQWATTRLRDLPVGGRPVRLRWRKRRWYCPTAACPRMSFTEQVAQVPARARLTRRLREMAARSRLEMCVVGDEGSAIDPERASMIRSVRMWSAIARPASPRSTPAPPL